MQVCTSLQTDNHVSAPSLSFFTGRMPFLPPNRQRQSTGSRKCWRNVHVVLLLTRPRALRRSMILSKRSRDDDARAGFTKWPFMTTQSWAENPRGRWKLFVILDSDEPQAGSLHEWSLLLHGTRKSPYVEQKVSIRVSVPDKGKSPQARAWVPNRLCRLWIRETHDCIAGQVRPGSGPRAAMATVAS